MLLLELHTDWKQDNIFTYKQGLIEYQCKVRYLPFGLANRDDYESKDLNKLYLEEETLKVQLLGRGMAWLDTGTHESLLQASNFIATIEQRQGLKVSCIEEIAYKKGFINKNQLLQLAEDLKKNQYGEYLMRLATDQIKSK